MIAELKSRDGHVVHAQRLPQFVSGPPAIVTWGVGPRVFVKGSAVRAEADGLEHVEYQEVHVYALGPEGRKAARPTGPKPNRRRR